MADPYEEARMAIAARPQILVPEGEQEGFGQVVQALLQMTDELTRLRCEVAGVREAVEKIEALKRFE